MGFMSRVSHILGYVLAAVIALTAQSAAVARTMPDATGQMVLCTGTGPVMVYTDEDGNPTSAPHICPDFAVPDSCAGCAGTAHRGMRRVEQDCR